MNPPYGNAWKMLPCSDSLSGASSYIVSTNMSTLIRKYRWPIRGLVASFKKKLALPESCKTAKLLAVGLVVTWRSSLEAADGRMEVRAGSVARLARGRVHRGVLAALRQMGEDAASAGLGDRCRWINP
jgi:hypothetical protein